MPDRLLLVHNYYQQRGGEDESFAAESELLRARGHSVVSYTVHNDEIEGMSRLKLARDTLWNKKTYREVRALIRAERPEVVHCNNIFPLVSPSVYYAARAEGVPVVQNLRNYRMYCLNGLFFRDGKVCEECLGGAFPWRGIARSCYRQSKSASCAVAGLLAGHRAIGTWTKMVDLYVCLTQFARGKFIEAGLPADMLACKPNFLPEKPELGDGRGGFALFVGRLSPEKGLGTLLGAWERLDGALPLKIVGDGPDEAMVAAAAARIPGVEWLGRKPLAEVEQLMADARMLVFPSTWYETFGRVGMEAFAKGTPVIAANIGAIAELVDHQENGLLFRPGDVDDLTTQIRWALDHPDEFAAMRGRARATFEARYTADRNYELLMEIYDRAKRRAGVRIRRHRLHEITPMPARPAGRSGVDVPNRTRTERGVTPR